MNCCIIIILLLLCGKCGSGNTSSCGDSCIQPRRRPSNGCGMGCDDDCGDSVSNCTRTEFDKDSCSCNMNMATDNFGQNRYSMYNMKDDDCGCRN